MDIHTQNAKASAKRIQGSTRSLNEIPVYANTIIHIILILGCILCIMPLVMIFSASITSSMTLSTKGYSFLPRDISFSAYEYLFSMQSVVGTAYRNTILSTLLGTALATFTVSLYAYPLSRKEFRYTSFFTFVSFFTMLFSGGLVPYYILCTQFLKINDTMFALFLPSGFSAFWVIVMRTFYKTNVPVEVIESARIDGSGEFRTLFQIVMPLAIPGLATVALFCTIGLWNNFYNCLLFIKDERLFNLQYVIYNMLRSIQFLKMAASSMGLSSGLAVNLAELPNESFRMAMAVITIGPIVAAYPFFQRFFVKGLTIGAIKG